MTEETPDAPNWLKELEAKRERRVKAKLGHETGAGSPCLNCKNDCPGLDLHFWRKICKNCKCGKESHDVQDDDVFGWTQFQLLGSKPTKSKKIVLPGKEEVELEWAPKGSSEAVEKYLKDLPPELLPVKGSTAAQERKQLLQKQIPIHDIDPSLCDALTEDEINQMNDYVSHVKESSVGVGQVVQLNLRKGNLHNKNAVNAHLLADRTTKRLPISQNVQLQGAEIVAPLKSLSLRKNDGFIKNPTISESVQSPTMFRPIKDLQYPVLPFLYAPKSTTTFPFLPYRTQSFNPSVAVESSSALENVRPSYTRQLQGRPKFVTGSKGEQYVLDPNNDRFAVGPSGEKYMVAPNGELYLVDPKDGRYVRGPQGESFILGANGDKYYPDRTDPRCVIGPNGERFFVPEDKYKTAPNGERFVIGPSGDKCLPDRRNEDYAVGPHGNRYLVGAKGAVYPVDTKDARYARDLNGKKFIVAPDGEKFYADPEDERFVTGRNGERYFVPKDRFRTAPNGERYLTGPNGDKYYPDPLDDRLAVGSRGDKYMVGLNGELHPLDIEDDRFAVGPGNRRFLIGPNGDKFYVDSDDDHFAIGPNGEKYKIPRDKFDVGPNGEKFLLGPRGKKYFADPLDERYAIGPHGERYIVGADDDLYPVDPRDERYARDPNGNKFIMGADGEKYYEDPQNNAQVFGPDGKKYVVPDDRFFTESNDRHVIGPDGQKPNDYSVPVDSRFGTKTDDGKFILGPNGEKYMIDPTDERYVIGPDGTKYFVPEDKYKIGPKGERYLVASNGDKFIADPSDDRYAIGPNGKKCIVGADGELYPVDPNDERYAVGPNGEKFILGPNGEKYYVDPNDKRYVVGPDGQKYLVDLNDEPSSPIADLSDSNEFNLHGEKYTTDPRDPRFVIDDRGDRFVLGPNGEKYLSDPYDDRYVIGPHGENYLVAPNEEQYIIGPEGKKYPIIVRPETNRKPIIDSKYPSGHIDDYDPIEAILNKSAKRLPIGSTADKATIPQYTIPQRTATSNEIPTESTAISNTIPVGSTNILNAIPAGSTADKYPAGFVRTPVMNFQPVTETLRAQPTGTIKDQPYDTYSNPPRDLNSNWGAIEGWRPVNYNPSRLDVPENLLNPTQVNVGIINDIAYETPTAEVKTALQKSNDVFEPYSPIIKSSADDNVKVAECHQCKKVFEDNAMVIQIDRTDALWHAGCFRCAGCNQNLADLVYFYDREGDRIFCGRDYAKIRGIPRCNACDELIFVKEYCLAENCTFHVKHFCCFECDTPLAGQNYVMEDSQPICLPCYDKLKANKCNACSRIIKPDEQGAELKGVHFHASDDCFACKTCKKPLLGSKLLFRKEQLYCSVPCFNADQ